LLFELVTRAPPHGILTTQQELLSFAFRAANEGSRPALLGTISPTWRRVLTSAWDPDPSRRPSFQRLLDEFAGAQQNASLSLGVDETEHEYI